jgi:hypothetical protein
MPLPNVQHLNHGQLVVEPFGAPAVMVARAAGTKFAQNEEARCDYSSASTAGTFSISRTGHVRIANIG